MARPTRIDYAGAVHHPPSPRFASFGETGVMARGNQGQVMGHYTRVSQAMIRLRRKTVRKLEELERLLLEAEVEND